MLRRFIRFGAVDPATVSNINAWQSQGSLKVAGIPVSDFSETTNQSGGSGIGGRTFIPANISYRIMQDGYIRRVSVMMSTTGFFAQTIKAKVLRPNGSNYDLVSETSFPVAAAGTTTVDLPTPMACRAGDVLGIWTGDIATYPRLAVKYIASGDNTLYASGDVNGTGISFPSTTSNYTPNIEGKTNRPYIAITGDSIAEGHNTANSFHGIYDNGPAGTSASQIAYQLRASVGGGNVLEFQNHAKGSQTYAWVASTGIVSAVACGARIVWIHCGVNDAAAGRTWAAVQADLDTIAAAVAAANPRPLLYVDEVLPWTSGTEFANNVARGYNTNLVTWCAANGARLIRCHDEMGQVRPASGNISDLVPDYSYDGLHLSQAGVNKMAEIYKRYM